VAADTSIRPGQTHAATLLDALAARTAALTGPDVDERGVHIVRTALADTMGVTIAGAGSGSVRIVREATMEPAPTGPCLVVGTRERRSALDAGLLNAMAAHALDYDDGNIVIVGHPSTVLVPAVLALGEETGASAADAMLAYAAGYEVLIRLARGVNTAHYVKGWHPTSTLGGFGAAAAAAKLLDLDAGRTATALAIAASHAAGIKANFGTMTKALHIGQSVRGGLLAAKLAAAGFTANPAALEAPQGFLEVYNGAGTYDTAAILADPQSYEINRGLNPIKGYPCCHSTHASIEAARQIRAEHMPRPDDIERIDIVVDAMRMPHTDRPHFTDALAGKFSLQYVVSRALADGTVRLEHFDGQAHLDPTTQALMRRAHVRAATGPATNSFAGDVTVTTTGGQSFRVRRDPAQDPAELSANPPQLWDKLTDCAARVLPAADVSALVEALCAFPASGDIRHLMRLTEGGRA
jgi:2-methylcitrate dehydratase PrpD